MPETVVLRVAVPAPLHATFDYLPPAGVDVRALVVGARVRVPFGRRHLIGVLVEVAGSSTLAHSALRHAFAVIDTAPTFGAAIFDLCRWAAGYYHHPLGEVLAAALPKRLRQGRSAERTPPRRWRVTVAGREADPATLRRAPKQALILTTIAASPDGVDEEDLRDRFEPVRAALAALTAKGLVERWRGQAALTSHAAVRPGPDLNPEQAAALAAIPREGFAPILLDGVTGSGKTEIYLRLIDDVLAAGRQALVLVPEIGLTPQLIARFRERVAARVVVLHSGLGDGERLDGWLAARDGEAGVVIGTRSAIFTPLARPGLFVVDEEHDLSFKQQDGFRYSARDLAVRRAADAGVPVVLGSATPSLESLGNALGGRYRHVRLQRRAADAAIPEVHVLDVRGRPLREGISELLLDHMHRHLDAGGQTLLFLNRRGFAPTLMCHQCGWAAECRRCDARMTLHRRHNRLRCHHCGAELSPPTCCPACESADLLALGQGTQRVEEIVCEAFPGVGVARIDRDTTGRKGSFESMLAAIDSGETRILIGTQMLAKGHHFPGITLVGVINVDQGLFGTDFRAIERMAQLIVQVSGRAGRAERAGEVFIQTHHPEHPLLVRLIRDGYRSFAEAALAERRQATLPPFSFLALLRAESTAAAEPMRFLEQAAAAARRLGTGGLELWGPVPAPMERRAGRVRAQLLVQSAERARLHALLRPWVRSLGELPAARRVRWSIDVDPQDLM